MRKSAILLVVMLSIVGFGVSALAQDEVKVGAQKTKAVKKSEEVILLERGGVLLPQGTLVVEPGFQYTHISKNRVSISGFTLFQAILIGKIVVEDLERDILIPSLTMRYGIFDRLELAFRAPWLYRNDKETWEEPVTGEFAERTISDDGLGDIEGALYWQVINERGAVPDVILNLKAKAPTGRDPYELERGTYYIRVKNSQTGKIEEQPRQGLLELPTGTGHWGVSGGFTFVKTTDPAVLFANVGYYYNIERNVGIKKDIDYGKVDPGDSIEYGLGIAYALNEKLSTSFSFQHRITFETEQNGQEIINSDVNVASIYLGGSYSPIPRMSINVNVGAGLTEDAPNVDINLSIPVYFSLL